MPLLLKIRLPIVITVCLGTLLGAVGAYAVMDPRFELDPQSLAGMKGAAKTRQGDGKQVSRTHTAHPSLPLDEERIYTVKPGDQLIKLLMRRYGLSRKEVRPFIEDIKRENSIHDIEHIKVGQKIIFPVRERAAGSRKTVQANGPGSSHINGSGTSPQQSFKLESPVTALSERESLTRAVDVWNRIVPSKTEQRSPLTFQTATFSLTLDPENFPTFARMDGGRLVLDKNGTLPPLVKSLIEDKDASVQIVTEAPSATKRFMASLIGAARFYSVEEDFSMEFGVDPKITVQADFKVEKTADSLIKQDVVLVNSGRTALPAIFGEFLKKEGFSLYEPFATLKSFAQSDTRAIHSISSTNRPEMVDSILSALSVSPERGRSLDVFAGEKNGISLSVKAERYFERGGQRFVVTSFDGDPINYTLFRILETRGFNVVILETQDNFRTISEKLISRMKIKGSFAQHRLLRDGSSGYSLDMSGFKLNDPLLPGGGIFLTDRVMDKIIKDLCAENGFSINSR